MKARRWDEAQDTPRPGGAENAGAWGRPAAVSYAAHARYGSFPFEVVTIMIPKSDGSATRSAHLNTFTPVIESTST